MAKSKVKKTTPKPKAPKIVERSCTLTLRLGHAPTIEVEELEKLFGIKQGSKAIERVIMSYRARLHEIKVFEERAEKAERSFETLKLLIEKKMAIDESITKVLKGEVMPDDDDDDFEDEDEEDEEDSDEWN
jgi:hypothetical protein